jgi:hypothetical protein
MTWDPNWEIQRMKDGCLAGWCRSRRILTVLKIKLPCQRLVGKEIGDYFLWTK